MARKEYAGVIEEEARKNKGSKPAAGSPAAKAARQGLTPEELLLAQEKKRLEALQRRQQQEIQVRRHAPLPGDVPRSLY